jgi:hypothetical protein
MAKNGKRGLRTGATVPAVVLAVLCAWTAPAHALDIDPADYVALPDGTDIALGYARFAHAGRMTLKGGGDVPGSRLNTMLGIVAYARYVNIGGFTIAPHIFIPYGRYGEARAGGAGLPDAQGAGDPFASVTAWLVNRPEENCYFGLSAYVFAPLGAYDAGKPLNIGGNRWKGVFQAGLVHGVAPKLSAELTVDMTVYGDNRRAGDGTQTLSQRRSWQVQPWLRYNVDPGFALSLGWSASFGGAQRLDGTPAGFTAEAHAVKFDYRRFVTPTLQFAATLSRDFAVNGGFQESARLNLRVMKIF